MNDIDINSEYFSDKPHSYGGKYRLYELYNKDDVDTALTNNDVYTRFKQHRKSKKYSPIYVYKKRELFQSDTVFFTNNEFVEANHGYKYLFTTIDVFTKMAWVYPMKDNKCKTVMECFQDILRKCGEKPQRLNSDRGSELICNQFKKYLKDNNIHHYLSYSLRKCPVIERFNLTIQTLLYKIMRKNNSHEWTKYLDQAMNIYLHRKHRTIKMSPLEAEKDENEMEVRRTYFEKYVKAGEKTQTPKFSLGDSVRIFKERGTFHRGYKEDFTTETFIITKVLTNLPVPRYKLKEANGDEVVGSFFQDELVLYNPPEFFEIDVLKTRGKGKNKEFLVHYRGWPHTYDEWKKALDMKDL
jgi:hypothetical protein